MLAHWALLEADFQEHYGLDLSEAVQAHSARWLRTRILGLLATTSRLRYALYPPSRRGGET